MRLMTLITGCLETTIAQRVAMPEDAIIQELQAEAHSRQDPGQGRRLTPNTGAQRPTLASSATPGRILAPPADRGCFF